MGLALVKNVKAADNAQSFVFLNDDVNVDNDGGDDDLIDLQVPARVKKIHIDGLSVTKNKLVTKQLERLFDCKTFDSVMTESHLCKLKLERLGIFRGIEVFIDVADSKKNGEFDVHYFVKESRRLSANAGTHVGHNEGSMSMGGRVNNIRGLGETLKANATFGTSVSSSYEFSFSKPMLHDPDKKFSIRALKSLTDYVQSQYKEDAKGLVLDFTLPSPFGVHTLAWDYIWRENIIHPSAPFDIREHAGNMLKSAIRHSFVSDGRDDWIFPSDGHLLKHNVEYSGVGGNVKGWKTDIELQLNKELFPDIVLAAAVNTGVARSLTNEPLAINDRYFVGGPLSVRGFAMKGVGNHSLQASMGGEVFWASGLHLYTPLPFRPGRGGFGDLFRMHFFANAGNLSDTANLDMNEFLKRPRYSYGLGLMFMLGGMARLEVNYCIPRNAQPGDIINEGWQIGVGLNFL